jgi:copper transport protein
VAPGLSVISILDRSNYVVAQGGSVDARDAKVMALPVDRLRPGIYTVSWKVLSAVDGHITRGAFAFTFLPAGTDPAKLLESGRGSVASQGWSRSLLALTLILAGWIHLAALFVGVGGLHFPLLVLASHRGMRREEFPDRPRMLDAAGALAAKAFGVAFVSGLIWWEINTHFTTDTTLAHFLFRPILVPYLLGSRTTQSMALRLAMLLQALIFLGVARRRTPPSRLLLGYCEAVGAVALLGIALSSHSAAARAGPLSILSDTLHLWAGALWVGGLVFLITNLPHAVRGGKSEGWDVILFAMRRFTPWAAGSVAALVFTGAFQVYLHIPGPRALVGTTYGQALSLKLLLVAGMLLLGGINSFTARTGAIGYHPPKTRGWASRMSQVVTRIQTYGAQWTHARQWAARGETALALGILFCVAVLTQLPPPKAVSSVPPPATQRATASGLDVELTITSPEGLLAPSDLTVRVRQADGRASDGVTRVTLKPSMPGMEMSIAPILATRGEKGEYRAQTLFSMLGRWELSLAIRRKGVEEDAIFRFPYVVLDAATSQTDVGPALPERLSLRAAWSTPSTQGRLLTGASLIALGLGIASGFGGRAPLWRRRRLLVGLAGLPLILGGGYQVVNAMVIDTTPTAWQENPIPADPPSLNKGRALFMANCSVCHGESGRGDGPVVAGQPPGLSARAELTAAHMEAHSDGDLFWWIGKGVPGTAMPGFEDSLKPEDRWHLVNYVRSLRSRGQGRAE